MTRLAAGKLSTPHKMKEEYPVTITKGVQKFQRNVAGKWVTVCSVPNGENGKRNLTHHYGKVLGRKIGRDFRFVYRAK